MLHNRRADDSLDFYLVRHRRIDHGVSVHAADIQCRANPDIRAFVAGDVRARKTFLCEVPESEKNADQQRRTRRQDSDCHGRHRRDAKGSREGGRQSVERVHKKRRQSERHLAEVRRFLYNKGHRGRDIDCRATKRTIGVMQKEPHKWRVLSACQVSTAASRLTKLAYLHMRVVNALAKKPIESPNFLLGFL